MAKKKTEDLEVRSEKVRKVIGPIPDHIVNIGYFVVLLIILAIVCLVVLISFPYGNGESIIRYFFRACCIFFVK